MSSTVSSRWVPLRMVSPLCLLALLAAAVCGDEAISLFDGKTLEGWNVLNCEAEIQDGAILLKAGNGLVQTRNQYEDFTFTCEWKALKSEAWDSGIYFRYTEVPEGRPWPNQYQVNLRQEMEGDLVGFANGKSKVQVKAGDWNKFELTVKGTQASLKVNGTTAWEVDGIKVPKGYIALQAEIPGGGQFLFRAITLRTWKK